MNLRRKVFPLLLASLLALSACGGDVTRVADYQPSRILVLGDEYSVVQATSSGSKYTVNDPTNCDLSRVWSQVLADHYGMAFEQCNPNGKSTAARMLAAAGAKVADIPAQAAQAGSAYTASDLFAVFAGTNDVLAIFQNAGLDEAGKHTQAQAAGTALAAAINTLIDGGARVLFVTVPDLGLSPYGRTSANQALLSALSESFNKALRLSVQQDGRYAAIVLADSMVRAATTSPGTYAFTNIDAAACATPAPGCTTSTLNSGADAAKWMWAEHVWLGPVLQKRLGELAVVRASNNPF